jgi:hypothetical protein
VGNRFGFTWYFMKMTPRVHELLSSTSRLENIRRTSVAQDMAKRAGNQGARSALALGYVALYVASSRCGPISC